jgi:hypothetical protein
MISMSCSWLSTIVGGWKLGESQTKKALRGSTSAMMIETMITIGLGLSS